VRKVRQTCYQVQPPGAHAAGAHERKCSGCVRRAVCPARAGQHARVKRLHAQANAVDAQLQPGVQLGGVKSAGVCLQRHLAARREAEALRERLQHPAQLRRGQQRGRATAEGDSAQRRSRPGGCYVCADGVHVGADAWSGAAAISHHVDGKVAVEAAAAAEGYVHIGAGG